MPWWHLLNNHKKVQAKQQKNVLELSNKLTLALYKGFPDQLVPCEIKNQKLQSFMPPPGKGANPGPPRGVKSKFSKQKSKETQSGLKKSLPQDREPQCSKDQKDSRTVKLLEFCYHLCNLLNLFNKLNDSKYINGIVNLSSHTLTNTEISVLSTGLGFCPTRGYQILAILSMTRMLLKEELDFNYFSLVPIRIHQKWTPNQEYHLNISPSNSNHPSVGPFQLESVFYSIEQDLHRQNREPQKKNLTKEYKAIRYLNKNKDIIIKPADKGSALVILDKQSNIDEGQRQLHNTQFYEETDSDLTHEVIHRINLHVFNMLQKGQISQTLVTISQLTFTELNNFIYYQKSTRIHIIHQEVLSLR